MRGTAAFNKGLLNGARPLFGLHADTPNKQKRHSFVPKFCVAALRRTKHRDVWGGQPCGSLSFGRRKEVRTCHRTRRPPLCSPPPPRGYRIARSSCGSPAGSPHFGLPPFRAPPISGSRPALCRVAARARLGAGSQPAPATEAPGNGRAGSAGGTGRTAAVTAAAGAGAAPGAGRGAEGGGRAAGGRLLPPPAAGKEPRHSPGLRRGSGARRGRRGAAGRHGAGAARRGAGTRRVPGGGLRPLGAAPLRGWHHREAPAAGETSGCPANHRAEER